MSHLPKYIYVSCFTSSHFICLDVSIRFLPFHFASHVLLFIHFWFPSSLTFWPDSYTPVIPQWFPSSPMLPSWFRIFEIKTWKPHVSGVPNSRNADVKWYPHILLHVSRSKQTWNREFSSDFQKIHINVPKPLMSFRRAVCTSLAMISDLRTNILRQKFLKSELFEATVSFFISATWKRPQLQYLPN